MVRRGCILSTIVENAELEKKADEIIEVIRQAQLEDGYLNTYFTIKEPEHRWQNLFECNELYCAGHMMEAAVAYYEATGKDVLLKVMERMAEHISSQFGPEKRMGFPGHQEVEIGLMRLYHATGKEEYRDLSKYFIDVRGTDTDFFKKAVGNAMLDRQEGNKLFQLLMDFYQKTSIIAISNKGVSEWARTLGDNVGTTAIMDRLLHHCEVFNIDGDSWRLENKTNILADLLDPK